MARHATERRLGHTFRVRDPTYHRHVTAIEELVYLLEDAFASRGNPETGESQSVLGNLTTVPEELWRVVPPGGERTIATHASYHAGEVNHIRSLRGGDEAWMWSCGSGALRRGHASRCTCGPGLERPDGNEVQAELPGGAVEGRQERPAEDQHQERVADRAERVPRERRDRVE